MLNDNNNKIKKQNKTKTL